MTDELTAILELLRPMADHARNARKDIPREVRFSVPFVRAHSVTNGNLQDVAAALDRLQALIDLQAADTRPAIATGEPTAPPHSERRTRSSTRKARANDNV